MSITVMKQKPDSFEALQLVAELSADKSISEEEANTLRTAIASYSQAIASAEHVEAKKQEPVAWLDEEKKIIYWHNTHETDDYHGFKRTTPLYTSPPLK